MRSIVPIGGGGLCAGVSCAIKTLQPGCRVYGVEPEGADTMHRSFAAGSPQAIDRVTTIADSLGAPYAQPYSYELCRRYVDELVRIDDEAMRRAMGLLFAEMKLAVEPAGAAATAALLGPLAERLRGQAHRSRRLRHQHRREEVHDPGAVRVMRGTSRKGQPAPASRSGRSSASRRLYHSTPCDSI